MGRRQRMWARNETIRIKNLLGNRCAQCGSTKNLQFDVIFPVENNSWHHKVEWSWRISFYRQQLEANNLQLLCEKHNQRKQNQLELMVYRCIPTDM